MMSDQVNESVEVGMIKHNEDYDLPTEETLMRIRNLSSEHQQLQGENDALRASNKRLLGQLVNTTSQLSRWMMSAYPKIKDAVRPHVESANKVIYETPQQSLAEIEAAAIEKASNNVEAISFIVEDGKEVRQELFLRHADLIELATQLRQQGGE